MTNSDKTINIIGWSIIILSYQFEIGIFGTDGYLDERYFKPLIKKFPSFVQFCDYFNL